MQIQFSIVLNLSAMTVYVSGSYSTKKGKKTLHIIQVNSIWLLSSPRRHHKNPMKSSLFDTYCDLLQPIYSMGVLPFRRDRPGQLSVRLRIAAELSMVSAAPVDPPLFRFVEPCELVTLVAEDHSSS